MSPESFATSYTSKLHSIQTAVLHDINCNGAKGAAADSKHLRTGLNAVMTDLGSLFKLLMDKGIITEHEMQEAVLAGLDREIERYQTMYPGIQFL